MTIAEFVSDLLRLNLAASAGIMLMFALRIPIVRLFGARVRYAAWLIVPVAVAVALLPPPVTITGRARPAPAYALAKEPPINGSVVDSSIPPQVDSAPALEVAARAAEAVAPVTQADWTSIAFTLWAAGALASLALVMLRQQLFLRAAGREALGPAVVGFIRPRIHLPPNFETAFPPVQQALILAHERVHLARQDARVNGVVTLLQCVNWFNPLVHVAARVARRDQEAACDEVVIAAHPHGRRDYAQALLRTQLATAALPLGCYWPPRASRALEDRIAQLKAAPRNRARRLAGAALVSSLATAAGYAAWAAQPPTLSTATAGNEALAVTALPDIAASQTTRAPAASTSIAALALSQQRRIAGQPALIPAAMAAGEVSHIMAVVGALAPTFVSAPAAAGQPALSPAVPAPAPRAAQAQELSMDGVTVTRPQDRIVRDFVDRYTAESPMGGRVSRLRSEVCPFTFGLPSSLNNLITYRVRQRALQAGAPGTGSGNCKINVRIVITNDPQPFMDEIAKEYDGLLGYHYFGEKRRVSRVKQPVQAWYITETEDWSGLTQIDQPERSDWGYVPLPGQGPPTYSAGSRLSVARSWIRSVLIIVDLDSIGGMDVGALADHVAMVALARGQTEAACKPMRSIANLFNEACPVTFKANTMTDGDLAYLKALYVASPTATANVQRTEIARRMGQMLDDAQ